MGYNKQMRIIKESRRRILNESGERGNSKGGKVKLLVDIYDFNNSKVEAGIFVDDGFVDDEDRILKDVKRTIGMVRDHWNPKIVEVPDSTRKMVSIENLKSVLTPEAAFADLEDVLKEYEVSLIDWKEEPVKESRRVMKEGMGPGKGLLFVRKFEPSEPDAFEELRIESLQVLKKVDDFGEAGMELDKMAREAETVSQEEFDKIAFGLEDLEYNSGQYFAVTVDGSSFLFVDTQGYAYPRYKLLLTDEDIEEIWEGNLPAPWEILPYGG